MCGLINIKNEEDEVCFQLCMIYHQTAKGKHDSLLSKLKKVDDRDDYGVM